MRAKVDIINTELKRPFNKEVCLVTVTEGAVAVLTVLIDRAKVILAHISAPAKAGSYYPEALLTVFPVTVIINVPFAVKL